MGGAAYATIERDSTAIESLPAPSGPMKNLTVGTEKLQFREYSVDPENLPAHVKDNLVLNDQASASSPRMVPNAMILQFQPNTSKDAIDKLVKDRNFVVVETYPKLGAIKVDTDLGKYFTPNLSDTSSNQAFLRGVGAAIKDFKNEPIVRSATPDVVLRSQAEQAHRKLPT